jgi:DNA-binding CsgD family transcriptional regulator
MAQPASLRPAALRSPPVLREWPIRTVSRRALTEPTPDADPLAAACFEAHPQPQLVLNADCEVVASNRAARELIAEGHGPRSLAENLANGTGTFLREIREGLCAVARGEARSRDFELSLPNAAAFDLRVLPVSPGHALLLISRREGQPAVARFGFTPTEARVAELLCAGRNAAKIAAELGISIETVRCHLKQAFAKAGVHRQAELVALLLKA